MIGLRRQPPTGIRAGASNGAARPVSTLRHLTAAAAERRAAIRLGFAGGEMATTWQRETISKDIMEQVGPRGQRVHLIKPVASASVRSWSGDVPFWRTDLQAVAASDAVDPAAEP